MYGKREQTDCGDGSDNFTELEFVQDCGLSGSIKPNHQNSHLLLSPQLVEQFRKRETHGYGDVREIRVIAEDVRVKGCGGKPSVITVKSPISMVAMQDYIC